MLTFIVSEYGSIPHHSTIYESGYEIIAKEDMIFESSTTFNIKTGLILKCTSSDFIHLVIDDSYLNILKVENNIIENNINIPYDIKIVNLTNKNVTIEKNNKICHFYSKNKAHLYNTILQDNELHTTEVQLIVAEEVQPIVTEEVQSVITKELQPEVAIEEAQPEVVAEELQPEVAIEEAQPEVVVEELQPEVAIKEMQHVEIHPIVVEQGDIHNDIHNDIHEENTGLTQTQINANLAKRKYIRKKKMTINLP